MTREEDERQSMIEIELERREYERDLMKDRGQPCTDKYHSIEALINRNRCLKCGCTGVYVEREGMTGTIGSVKCSKCHNYIREWEAY